MGVGRGKMVGGKGCGREGEEGGGWVGFFFFFNNFFPHQMLS